MGGERLTIGGAGAEGERGNGDEKKGAFQLLKGGGGHLIPEGKRRGGKPTTDQIRVSGNLGTVVKSGSKTVSRNEKSPNVNGGGGGVKERKHKTT